MSIRNDRSPTTYQQYPDRQQPPAKIVPIILAIIVIVVAIIIIIAGLYVWVTGSLGPADPYSGYTLEIDGFFNGHDGLSTKGVVEQKMGYRIKPYGSMNYADRLYVSGGDGGVFSPYGIYAYETEEGHREWSSSAFETDSRVSTDVTVENFGQTSDPADTEIRIIFGCENGRLYVLKDEFGTPESEYPPVGGHLWSIQLDDSVSGIAVLINNTGNNFDSNDMIFASTDTGTLYAFRGPISHPVDSALMWKAALSSYGLTAPTIPLLYNMDDTNIPASDRFVFVGSRDGKLHGVTMSDGLPIPDWDGEYEVSANHWSSSPVAVGDPPVIYATTDDGYLHSIDGTDGTARPGWEGGLQVTNGNDEVDGGRLTGPFVTRDGTTIFFGSSTGHVYDYRSNGERRYDFDSSFDGALDTECVVSPYYYDWFNNKGLFVSVNCLNGTPNDPRDDFTYLYSLNSQWGVIWRLSLDGMVLAPPVSYHSPPLHLSTRDVVLATVSVDANGELSSGKLYSFSSTRYRMIPPN